MDPGSLNLTKIMIYFSQKKIVFQNVMDPKHWLGERISQAECSARGKG